VENTIDTGNATPLRSKLRRVSFHERDTVKIEVDIDIVRCCIMVLSNVQIVRGLHQWYL